MKGWGDDTEPLWKYLKDNSPNCKISKDIWWNFEKVLVNREGKVSEKWRDVLCVRTLPPRFVKSILFTPYSYKE